MLRQEILQMSPDEQLILRPGMRPIRACKIKWYQEAALRKRRLEPPEIPRLSVEIPMDDGNRRIMFQTSWDWTETCVNNPACEAAKSVQNEIYAANKLECEGGKTAWKAQCEVDKRLEYTLANWTSRRKKRIANGLKRKTRPSARLEKRP
jgi:hypothetical protein